MGVGVPHRKKCGTNRLRFPVIRRVSSRMPRPAASWSTTQTPKTGRWPSNSGIIAVSLDEGDELIGARITNGGNYIFLGSRQGQAIRFAEGDVRAMGRQARGVRAMRLAEGDYLVGGEESG